MKRLIWLLTALTLGCIGSIYTPPLERPCGHVFSPTTELLQETQIAVERWSKATGCEYSVGATGTPIGYVNEVYIKEDSEKLFFSADSETKPVCGVYVREDDRIFISRQAIKGCYYHGIGNIIVHEIGHALSGVGKHAADGILARTGKDVPLEVTSRLITESSLLQVCQYQDCKEFIPETDWSLVVQEYPYYAGLPD